MKKYRCLAIIFTILSLVLLIFIGFILIEPKEKKEKMENIVVLKTNLGEIKIELFLNQTPITAGNFKKLVEEGFYDNTKFHRVIDSFMIQGGDPTSKNDSLMRNWGQGGPGYTIEDEFVEGLSNTKWTLSMANTGRENSGGSQFFINLQDNTFLDFDKEPQSSKHPVFGKVIEGFEVVENIAKVETTGSPSDRPINPIIIEKAYIFR
jgi:peptidylprolyl isomerase